MAAEGAVPGWPHLQVQRQHHHRRPKPHVLLGRQAKGWAEERPHLRPALELRRAHGRPGRGPQPMTYDVILADPPWTFNVWAKDTGLGRSAESHYRTMMTDDICHLPIPAAKDCALFLWACWPTLPDALRV